MHCLSFFINKKNLGKKICIGMCVPKVPYGSYAPGCCSSIYNIFIKYIVFYVKYIKNTAKTL